MRFGSHCSRFCIFNGMVEFLFRAFFCKSFFFFGLFFRCERARLRDLFFAENLFSKKSREFFS
jgi:hypothetical protein